MNTIVQSAAHAAYGNVNMVTGSDFAGENLDSDNTPIRSICIGGFSVWDAICEEGNVVVADSDCATQSSVLWPR